MHACIHTCREREGRDVHVVHYITCVYVCVSDSGPQQPACLQPCSGRRSPVIPILLPPPPHRPPPQGTAIVCCHDARGWGSITTSGSGSTRPDLQLPTSSTATFDPAATFVGFSFGADFFQFGYVFPMESSTSAFCLFVYFLFF